MIRLILFIVGMIATCSVCEAGEASNTKQVPAARTLIQAAIDLRKKIQSGKLVIRVLNMNELSPTHWTLFFNNAGSYRSDMSADGEGERLIIPHEIITPSQSIVDYGRGEPLDLRKRSTNKSQTCFNPRIFGYVPSQIQTLGQYGINHLLLNHEYLLDDRAEATTINGHSAWLCMARHKQDPKATIKTWVISDFGPIIVKIEADQGSGGNQRQIHTVESRYKKFGSTWFPEVINVLRTKGETAVMRESATIETAEFIPIPDAAFSLAGLDLLEGREVLIDGRQTKYVRDGELQSNARRIPAEPSKPSASAVWLSRLAAVVIAVTGFILIRRRHKSRAS